VPVKTFRIRLNCRAAMLALGLAAAAAVVACDHNDTDTTPTGGSLAQVEMGVPDGPVTNQQSFNIDVKARDGGFSVLHGTRVHLVLPNPLVVEGADVNDGPGTVTFSNGVSGGIVDFDFGSVDKFSQKSGTIHAHGVLQPTQNNVKVTVTAEMTSDEVDPGDAVAEEDVTIQQ